MKNMPICGYLNKVLYIIDLIKIHYCRQPKVKKYALVKTTFPSTQQNGN